MIEEFQKNLTSIVEVFLCPMVQQIVNVWELWYKDIAMNLSQESLDHTYRQSERTEISKQWWLLGSKSRQTGGNRKHRF